MPSFYASLRGHCLALLLPLLLILHPASATHIVGGELDLQFVAGNSYRLNLTLYFDAIYGSAGALDNTLTASIFEKGSNWRMQDVSLSLNSNTLVSYSNPVCAVGNLSTRLLLYGANVDLPAALYANPAGYYVAVERCCRNNSITNIQNPSFTGQTFYLEFPAVVRAGQRFVDSTPRIFPPLNDYACRGELFSYNFGGQDSDGDSLVYELVTPLTGHSSSGNPKPTRAQPEPYAPILWGAGRSELNQMPGAPTLTIGRTNGRLEVRPTQLGLFVFGIKCSEYRRKEKIGEVRRDFQILVINCPTNSPPSARVLQLNSGQPYQPGRDTIRLTPGGDRCLTVRATDPDANSQLTLSVQAVNFAGALPAFSTSTSTIRVAGAPDTLVSQLCFPNCFSTNGQVYLLDVMVADNGCSLPRRDTVRVAFVSVPDPNGAPRVVATAGPALPLRAQVGDLLTFDVLASDPDNDPLTLTMTGRDFLPASLGAQFATGASGTGLLGRFSWRVPCAATTQTQYDFVFTATESPCGVARSTPLTIPILIDYANAPPTLAATLPSAPAGTTVVVRQALGSPYEATLRGLDDDQDALVLTATGTGFDLAAVGMSFTARNGAGQATGTFRWDPSCEASLNRPLEVTFQLREASCQPRTLTRTVRFELVSADTLAFLPPNIFTPNNDNLNDFFELPTLPPDFCGSYLADIRIYNRWGGEVYHTKDRHFRWNGSGLAAGVYFYMIDYTDKRRFKGTVTLAP